MRGWGVFIHRRPLILSESPRRRRGAESKDFYPRNPSRGETPRGLIYIILLVLVFSSGSVWAAASDVNRFADRQTLFNSITDSFAANGKSESEKREIKRKRRQERRKKRLEKIKADQIKKTRERFNN